MRTIFILMDSLNRHYLKPYGGWVETPNIERLARRSVVFDRHYAGSLPCMPARREILTGRINFLETAWGAIEPFDDCTPTLLRDQKRVYSHMISDHYHYWEQSAHGYHTVFDSWEFIRGQEGDPFIGQVAEPDTPPFRGRGMGAKGLSKHRRFDWINRAHMDTERDEDYPTPQCFASAVKFLENNAEQDNWFLHLEVFDPHEPFACPQKYKDLYGDDWDGGYSYDWPEYQALDPEKDDPGTVEHVRKCYAGTLTMADVWLGKLLDTMDEKDMWKDTAIILTTDHGHLLGEHGYWAKNYMFDYEELVHIPLIVYHPDATPRRTDALTATIDLPVMLLDLFGAQPTAKMQGRSFKQVLLEGDTTHRDCVLFGYFGKDINICDGRYSYTRVARDNMPVFNYTAMPVMCFSPWGLEAFQKAEAGRFLPWTDGMPVFKIPSGSRRHKNSEGKDLLFDLENDPHQEHPLENAAEEKRMAELMRQCMIEAQAPPEQFDRMGFSEQE